MQFSDFIIADAHTQNHALTDAVHVIDIADKNGIRKLFQLYEFYIEKYFDRQMVLTQLNAFEFDSPVIDLYLQQINISELIA
jgi:hypothetical protein